MTIPQRVLWSGDIQRASISCQSRGTTTRTYITSFTSSQQGNLTLGSSPPMASTMAQSPQLTAGGQLPQYAPQQNGSRPGSAASHAQNRAGASSNSPPTFPYAPQQQPSAPTPPPPAPKQTPVPVPVPGQPAVNGSSATAGEPPKISSDVPKPVPESASPALSNGQTPSSEEIAKSQKFSEDYTKLCTLIAECDEDAVRRAVRDNFEKCLLGSHYHMAFIVRTLSTFRLLFASMLTIPR